MHPKKETFKETETLELKTSTSELKEAIISITAMLNKHQKGQVYFGITDKGLILGQDIGKNTLRNISKTISDHIEPKIFPQVKEISIENKSCILIEFQGKNIPYFAYGRAYMRIADEDRVLSAKELETLILIKNKEILRWDNQICKNATLKDIDNDTFNNFIELAKKSKRIIIDKEDKKLILTKLNLIQNNKLNFCGFYKNSK